MKMLIYRYINILFILFFTLIGCKEIIRKTSAPDIIPPASNRHYNSFKNFTHTKKVAMQIFSDHHETFYCGCNFNAQGVVDHNTCQFAPKKATKRSYNVEWEHLVTAKNIGQNRACWIKPICTDKDGAKFKGRKCCDMMDYEYNVAANDLHNLVPAIGEINMARGSKDFSDNLDVDYEFGACKIKIDHKNKLVEPGDEAKGVIARSYLYMIDKYHINITNKQLELFNHWNKLHPPEQWEIDWNKKAAKIQGKSNHYIDNYAYKEDKN